MMSHIAQTWWVWDGEMHLLCAVLSPSLQSQQGGSLCVLAGLTVGTEMPGSSEEKSSLDNLLWIELN